MPRLVGRAGDNCGRDPRRVMAPATTARTCYTGTAAGFNSAIARIGGLLATALAGAVIAQSGMALVSAFHDAALIGAALALASGAWRSRPYSGRERAAAACRAGLRRPPKPKCGRPSWIWRESVRFGECAPANAEHLLLS